MLASFVSRRRWWIISLTLFIIFSSSAGIKNLNFNNDYRAYFSQENPQLQAFEAIQKTYNKSDNILFILKPAGGNVFDPMVLQAIYQLTTKAWQLPFSSRVDSLTNFQHTVADGDELLVADLVHDPASLTQEQIRSIKQVALNEPMLVDRVISKSGHVSGVNVTVQLPEKNLKETVEVVNQARQLAWDIEGAYPEIKVYLSGVVMMSNAFVESALNDSKTLIPVMYAIVLAVALLSLRSFSAVFGVVLLILFSITAALGVFSWFGGVLTGTSAVSPTIILTIAVADSIHLLANMLHYMRIGYRKRKAIRRSLRANFQPILLTNLTTMVGFITMNFSDAPPLRDLGNISALGVAFACMLTIFFLPALMSVLPVKVKVKLKSKDEQNLSNLNRLSLFVIRHRKVLLTANALIAIFVTSFASMNELNDDFVKYFDETVDFRRATDFLNENMGGIDSIEFSIHAGEEGGINEPDFLQKLERFSLWLKQQPEVKNVNIITDIFKRLNKNMHGDDPAWYKLPDQRDLAAQYLLTYEMSLPYGLDLNNQINVDKSATRVIVTLGKLNSNQILAVESRFNEWLRQNMPEAKTEAASTSLMFAHIGKRNSENMILGSSFELGVISFILIVAFRSLRLGLISLIPNLVPMGVAFGIWGLIDGQISLGISVVASITFGIVVDDTVHFISKYRRARVELRKPSPVAVYYASSSAGEALWITTMILVSGFIVLSFSHFTVNSGMGLLSAITISIGLFMDMLFLPPLLMLLDKK
ncbi:efflux RND transporter permease subunit [Candidatus Methylomicrobium oryzae]|uniref:efflux RND transporter permease subunit n=1 Tax=Candidatus Methylomicrobium oryzae TaxID=2802053 RepID=UPI0019209180|nr:MMPL family transporter [Methylomicrobium sp. RS1]